MKISRIVFLCISIVALAAPAWSQPAGPDGPAHAVLGYLNPRSGVFMPMMPAPAGSDETPTPEASASTGKFVFNFTITIASAVPAGDVIQCGAEASVFDVVRIFDDTADFVTATRSGSSATCKVTIPYSWPLTTPSSDPVTLTYNVTTGAPTTGSAGQLTYRYSYGGLVPIKVPTAATTTENISVTF